MWKLHLWVLLLLCCIYGGKSSFDTYPDQLVKDLKWTLNPQDLAHHIEEQLATEEGKLLSRSCFRHLLAYAKGLLTFRIWAIQMFDASAKLPSGLLRGNGAALGSFDECLKVKTEHKKLGTINGKYCLGSLRLMNFTGRDFSRRIGVSNASSLQEERLLDLPERVVGLPWGVCLPDACSARDFRFLHLFLLRFSEESCQTKESQYTPLDGGDVAALSILGVIVALIVLSTTYDLITHYACKGRGSMLLRSFSIITNGSKIVTCKDNENTISCIHGFRVLSTIALMYGYSYLLFVFAPLVNWLGLVKFITDRNTSAVLEAIICGDTFLLISGLLISYNYFKAIEKGIGFNVVVYYFTRIIRLTPALGITMLIHATLMRHIGSGPVWQNIRDPWLVNNCRENWWSSLLYVQNYVNPNIGKICVMQTWQLSIDMQLFLLSPLILIPLRKAPKFTLSAVGFLLLCAIVSPFLAAWVYKLKAIIVTNRSLDDIHRYLEHFLFPTHTRASSWLIGFLTGYIIYETSKPAMRVTVRKKLNRLTALILWAISLIMLAFCIMIGRQMIGLFKPYNWVHHALHIALIRPAWCTAISWMIFACVHGYGGLINAFLSAPIFQTLSRINYGTNLSNLTLMFIMTYQTRIGLEFSNFNACYRLLGAIFPTFALGLVWTLAFESPIITIGNVIRNKSKDVKTKQLQETKSQDRMV